MWKKQLLGLLAVCPFFSSRSIFCFRSQLLTPLMTSAQSQTSSLVVWKSLSWGLNSGLPLTGCPYLKKILPDPPSITSACRPTHPAPACMADCPAALACCPPTPAWPPTATVPPVSAPVFVKHGLPTLLLPHPAASVHEPSLWMPSCPPCVAGAMAASGAPVNLPSQALCLPVPLRQACPAPAPPPAAAPARAATVKSQTWASPGHPMPDAA